MPAVLIMLVVVGVADLSSDLFHVDVPGCHRTVNLTLVTVEQAREVPAVKGVMQEAEAGKTSMLCHDAVSV